MLRRQSQNWRTCKKSVFSCKVLRTYIATHFLFVKIILPAVPCVHYKLMKLNFVICSVATLGKTYGLLCQKGVMVSGFFAFRKTKSCRQHAMLNVGDLRAFVTEWQGTIGEWSKIIYNWTLLEMLRQNRLC